MPPDPLTLLELPLVVDGYELEGLRIDVSTGFTRRTTVVHLHGGGEEGVGEDITYVADVQEQFQQARAGAAAGRHPHPRVVLGRAARARGLPPLGVRERRARPRAPPGRAVARRRARPRAPAAHVRRLDAPGNRRVAPPLPRAPLQGRRGGGLDGRRDRRAGRHRRDRHRRLQGLLPRHVGRPRARPGALPSRLRGLCRRVDRGRLGRRDDTARAGAARRPPHLGRPGAFGRRRRGAAVSPALPQRQAVALRLRPAAARVLRLGRGTRGSRSTAAASSSSGQVAARSSTSPRSSTRTRRTTSRRATSTAAAPGPGCRRARSRCEPRATGFLAG